MVTKFLNETKTELIILIILTENLPREPDIRINNYKLKLHSYIKYLGILTDDVLFWNEQVVSICIRPAKANDILSKLHHYLPKYICISICYSLFYTHLNYRCLVWSFSRKSKIDRKMKLQKRCIRIINFSDSNSHTDFLFYEPKLLKVYNIFSLSKPPFMFNFIKENIPEELKIIHL